MNYIKLKVLIVLSMYISITYTVQDNVLSLKKSCANIIALELKKEYEEAQRLGKQSSPFLHQVTTILPKECQEEIRCAQLRYILTQMVPEIDKELINHNNVTIELDDNHLIVSNYSTLKNDIENYYTRGFQSEITFDNYKFTCISSVNPLNPLAKQKKIIIRKIGLKKNQNHQFIDRQFNTIVGALDLHLLNKTFNDNNIDIAQVLDTCKKIEHTCGEKKIKQIQFSSIKQHCSIL